MTELPKIFDPAAIEQRWYAHWEANGLFRPDRPGAEPWTIVNPPPNVTGSLHIGHALDNTLQDILTRHARLKGKDALWVVGTDHAGIATQMVVERQMAAKGEKRTDLTREAFVARVWDWKAESGGQITQQLRRLGCSMDWANERFTMDEGFSAAVLKVFVDLHKQGLLYRDKRLVNWDAGLGTAISDLEVETREIQGKFWHLTYPLADGSGTISVATTRPETMLADMAVAVNPSDERYTVLIGRQVRLPITGRLIPVVADEHADPELGSGAVKITPGHDFNDFEVGRRAGIEARDMLNMLDAQARIVQCGGVPDELIGLDRFDARKRVVEMLEQAGALERVEDRVIQTPYGDRSGVVIEPWLTDQWYVDAKTLAQPAIEAVRTGAIKLVPKTWEKTFFNWMENIQPWCVSRQLWWGHRIPAWFAEDGRIFVAETEAEAQAEAGEGVPLVRDPDVLDTWFSSALWPFATLGWPEQSNGHPPFVLSEVEGQAQSGTSGGGASTAPGESLNGRYPNDVLISGFDILFFWDARMMMQGIHFMGDVPFKTLYLHGLVRAADGAKMSKSKGNTVDPLGLIDTYGADALRFFMAAMESQGRDIKMDEKRVEGYRNFATKLWNACRFAQANGIGGSTTLEPPTATHAVNQWIVAECVATVQAVDLALAELRFDAAANAIYQFVWSRFCDWYLELIKTNIDDETKAVAGWVLDQILVLLHPFMPFITEELWHGLAPRDHDLIVGRWPMPDARALHPEAEQEIDWLIHLVGDIRAARTELNVPPGARLPLHVRDASEQTLTRLERQRPVLARMARVDLAEGQGGGGAAQVVVEEATFILPLEGVIDLDAERTRLTKAIAAAEKERDALNGRLSNASFIERAKPEAVEKARADHADKQAEATRLQAALGRLG
ncbi:valine--tRNA ligase [Microvirga sp. SRT01]|uniref:Valine--tRNA ligase n=1 Tax=Sphingomonas longa TaxID=2778730 RepID=A0ABS2D266_9SPHN|nr:MULTISPECIES: valine--tRNA ligase [Alphaproteobacteria]MBM6575005.1 valine--tRNA ligase [Sphingomonas sp. BT552]MBR7708056.1 valine--tRNA ligase [Microvirga sp. SRT01]